jgi:hypothetical protein
MFSPDLLQVEACRLIRQPLLKGKPFLAVLLILLSIPAVRIPGGLTPP